jgi:hypothetical protein
MSKKRNVPVFKYQTRNCYISGKEFRHWHVQRYLISHFDRLWLWLTLAENWLTLADLDWHWQRIDAHCQRIGQLNQWSPTLSNICDHWSHCRVRRFFLYKSRVQRLLSFTSYILIASHSAHFTFVFSQIDSIFSTLNLRLHLIQGESHLIEAFSWPCSFDLFQSISWPCSLDLLQCISSSSSRMYLLFFHLATSSTLLSSLFFQISYVTFFLFDLWF